MDGYTLSISTTSAISIVSFLFGTLVGHRFALWRDQRREFNEAALPIIIRLLDDRKNPSRHEVVDTKDEYLILQLLPFSKRKGFSNTCTAYRATKSQHSYEPEFGLARLSNPTEAIKHIDKLLSYLTRQ